MIRFRNALLALFAAIALVPVAHAAIEPEDLLPVEEAFALEVRATARDQIEFHWTIADGYYLYRHRTAVLPVDAGFAPDPLQLPEAARSTTTNSSVRWKPTAYCQPLDQLLPDQLTGFAKATAHHRQPDRPQPART